MNKTTLFGMLTAAFVSTSSLALAENPQQKAQPPQKAQPQQQPMQGQGQGQTQGQGQAQAQNLAQEQIEGRVVGVDKSKSTVSVDTQQHGQLEFKLTPAQVQRMSEGDQVRLQIQIHSMPKQP